MFLILNSLYFTGKLNWVFFTHKKFPSIRALELEFERVQKKLFKLVRISHFECFQLIIIGTVNWLAMSWQIPEIYFKQNRALCWFELLSTTFVPLFAAFRLNFPDFFILFLFLSYQTNIFRYTGFSWST